MRGILLQKKEEEKMKNKKWMTAACTAALLGAPLQSLSFLGDNYFLESKGSEEQGAWG